MFLSLSPEIVLTNIGIVLIEFHGVMAKDRSSLFPSAVLSYCTRLAGILLNLCLSVLFQNTIQNRALRFSISNCSLLVFKNTIDFLCLDLTPSQLVKLTCYIYLQDLHDFRRFCKWYFYFNFQWFFTGIKIQSVFVN